MWREARGKYFVWLHDDDMLSDDFVEGHVAALEAEPRAVLEAEPRAVLAFGLMHYFFDYEALSDLAPYPLAVATHDKPIWRRLVKDRHSRYELKGLFRRDVLEGYGWYDHTVSPDWPLLTYLMVSGEVVEAKVGSVYNGCFEVDKTGARRAQEQSFSGIERFPTVTLSWRSGLASRQAAARRGRRRLAVVDAALTLASLVWWSRKAYLPAALGARRRRTPSSTRS